MFALGRRVSAEQMPLRPATLVLSTYPLKAGRVFCAVPLSADQFKPFDFGRGEAGGLSNVHAPVHVELGPSSHNLLFFEALTASAQNVIPVDSRLHPPKISYGH